MCGPISGRRFFQLGDLDKAIELFEGSLKMDPKHEYTLQNLVVVSIQKGDKARAEDALVRLAAVNASNPALGPLRKSLEELKTTGKIPTH
ncbi:MAG: tetratricopeptide repeat protein [Blastocatellia bacterium]|nr:tetratricopeptide repeat protein [Blastocatellia bacterium]